MKLKTITVQDKTYAEVVDGKPVYVHDDGKEIPFDAGQSVGKIKELNAEAKGHREAKETAEAALKRFEGIDDPDAARSALETVSNLDQGKLVQAGKVEEIKAAAKKAAEEQVADVKKTLEAQLGTLQQENAGLRSGWDSEKIGTTFAASKYVTDKLALPGPALQKIFGENFKVEENKIVGYVNGQKVFSRENPGETASFDEALTAMVDAYPFRESIVRGSGGGSGGGRGNGGGNGKGEKQVTRGEFDRMSQEARATAMREGFTVVDG